MMQALKLEVFAEDPSPGPDLAAEAIYEQQTQGIYESGYQAGWEDARAAQARDEGQEAAEVTRSLQALEFTFHDARAHILRNISPLIQDVAARLLPKIATESLPPLIVEALLPLVDQASEAPIELLVHPTMRDRVATHLATLPTIPVVLIDAPDQPPARIDLRLGERETRIDLQAALDAIEQLLRNYFSPPSEDARYG